MSLFKNPEPGPLYTVADAAKLIAEPGEDIAAIANQLRRFAQRGDVLTRGQTGSGRTAGNLFSLADIAVARVQRTVMSLGLADASTTHEIQIGCYHGAYTTPENPNGHPVTAALLDCHQHGNAAPHWVCQLILYYVDGERQMDAKVFPVTSVDHDDYPGIAVSIRVPMRDFLIRIATKLDA